ncbi:MAG TPA: DUF4019 domain-containing protein [Gemmatimonadota bacterium]|nr:DUF4019 domain-containing protein [Gemmatimonadota bacterium]
MNCPPRFWSAPSGALAWVIAASFTAAPLAAQAVEKDNGAEQSDVAPESVAVPDELGAAADAAAAWLGFLDEGDFDRAWTAASSALQVRMSPQSLKASIEPGRRNVGNVVGHTLLGFRVVTDPPNAEPGDYAIFQYRTADEEGRRLVENVVLRPEGDGWSVAGYFTARN